MKLLTRTTSWGECPNRLKSDFLSIPSDWPNLTVTRIHIHDHVLDIQVDKQTVAVTTRVRGQNPLDIRVPDGLTLSEQKP